MSALQVDLTETRGMDRDRVTEHEGAWYLRQCYADDFYVGLRSERAPSGTLATDLKPAAVEIVCDYEDGLSLDVAQLAAFCAWPPGLAS